MPVLSQGYEPYRGTFRRRNLQVLSIARVALQRNRRWWVWALLLLSVFAGSIKEYFLVFMVYVPSALFKVNPSDIPNFFRALAEHPRFYSDMLSTQAFWALVMGVTVGAGEIAEDLRTGALAFYLGRPVTRFQYVAGKTAAVAAVVLLVSFLPVCLLFAGQALFEGTWSWLSDHALVIPRAFAFNVLLSLFVSAVVLGMSAVARRRLWATVAIAGAVVALFLTSAVLAPAKAWTSHGEGRELHRALDEADTPEERRAAMKRFSDATDDLGSASDTADWKAVSPFSSLSAAARDLFGSPLPPNFSGGRHWILLLGSTALFYGLLYRRVRAVEVVT
jgi:ABC-type transport system involved in multi-copper enzyme maturation permease subunit